ncbi:I78 family peptidase inhibitor [Sodalis sp. RH19]
MHTTIFAALLTAFSLAACSGAEKSAATQSAVKPLTADDTCMANNFRNLIGKPESVLDGMRFSMPMRLIKPGQAVTMDFDPKRLNFMSNKEGIITSVHCS